MTDNISEGEIYALPVGGRGEKPWIAFFKIVISEDKKYYQYIGSKYHLGENKHYQYLDEVRDMIRYPDEARYLKSIRADNFEQLPKITLCKFYSFYDSCNPDEIPRFLFGKKTGILLPRKKMLCYGDTLKSYICLISEADYATSPEPPVIAKSNSLLEK